MNKRVITQSTQTGLDYFGLIICGTMFICGCVAGTASAGFAAEQGFTEYFAKLLPLAGDASVVEAGFFAALIDTCKYHLAVVFFGFSILGVICLPVLSAVRGFFLCFSISAIVRHFGGDGVFLALAVCGINAILALPCFFLLSVQAFTASLRLFMGVTAGGAKSVFPPYGGGYFRQVLICFVVLAFTALLDMLVVPDLVSNIIARMA